MAMELADFRAESATLRNQDLTVRRLEERKKALEAQLAEKVGCVGSIGVGPCRDMLQAGLSPKLLTTSCRRQLCSRPTIRWTASAPPRRQD
jgi:hypothetical protein